MKKSFLTIPSLILSIFNGHSIIDTVTMECENLRSCLVTVFVFHFRFLVFKEKKKTIFSCFQNEKHIWLVERKNTFSKNKIQEICLVVVFEKVEFCFV